MEDMEFNAMISFQFFCNEVFKQKNIDKLMPKGMAQSEWKSKKTGILSEEIDTMHQYLDKQAAMRLENYPSGDKESLEKRFRDTIARAIDGYKEKISHYYYL